MIRFRIPIAIAIGLAVSRLFLAIIRTQTGRAYDILFWLQIPGFVAGFGFSFRAFPYVMVSVNAILYSLIAFGILSAFGPEEKLD
jgi:hypothetical protein